VSYFKKYTSSRQACLAFSADPVYLKIYSKWAFLYIKKLFCASFVSIYNSFWDMEELHAKWTPGIECSFFPKYNSYWKKLYEIKFWDHPEYNRNRNIRIGPGVSEQSVYIHRKINQVKLEASSFLKSVKNCFLFFKLRTPRKFAYN
jgi:hypothetical protein